MCVSLEATRTQNTLTSNPRMIHVLGCPIVEGKSPQCDCVNRFFLSPQPTHTAFSTSIKCYWWQQTIFAYETEHAYVHWEKKWTGRDDRIAVGNPGCVLQMSPAMENYCHARQGSFFPFSFVLSPLSLMRPPADKNILFRSSCTSRENESFCCLASVRDEPHDGKARLLSQRHELPGKPHLMN